MALVLDVIALLYLNITEYAFCVPCLGLRTLISTLDRVFVSVLWPTRCR